MIGTQPMLRCASPESIAANNPLGMASFPLVPYSNRIAHGAFNWNDKPVKLSPNFPPEPHAIHGVGWKRRWSAEKKSNTSATLTFRHLPDNHWPWPFEALQTITILEHQLKLELQVHNLSDCSAPLAFGHHPYFEQAGATLQFASQHVWLTDGECLPTIAIKPSDDFDFNDESAVEGRSVDNCYSGCTGTACISWQDRTHALEITSSPALQAAVVYIPENGAAFCFEPVPHVNNALNLTGTSPAMPVIAAFERFTTTLVLRAIPARK
jgi:aldose 1-epimerase